MNKSAKTPGGDTKQLPLFVAHSLTPSDIETDEEVRERHRLALIAKEANERRHERWQRHNQQELNRRPCPCDKPECKVKRR